MPNTERTKWRDERISLKHRDWGVSCSATDIDFTLIEYIENEPKALIEYKLEYAKWNKQDAGIKALTSLACMAALPAYVVEYTNDLHYYRIYPLTAKSSYLLDAHNITSQSALTEKQYAIFLNKIRGRQLSETECNSLFDG